MKDVGEALYCMGQMADKCLTSLGAIQKDYNKFVSLVRRMREAQKEWETDLANDNDEHWGKSWEKDRLEREVDEHLKKMEDLK